MAPAGPRDRGPTTAKRGSKLAKNDCREPAKKEKMADFWAKHRISWEKMVAFSRLHNIYTPQVLHGSPKKP